MTINLEIIKSAYLFDKEEIKDLNTKKIVPKMIFRRRFTRSTKIIIELMDMLKFTKGRIVYGSSFGELQATSKILLDIDAFGTPSPTDFQNAVYNTPVSYASILHLNKNEILTVSSGDLTSLKVLKAGALKALDGDEILLLCVETLNIKGIEELNNCVDYLECAVGMIVKVTSKKANLSLTSDNEKNYPKSIIHMMNLAKKINNNDKHNVVEIKL